MNAEVFYPRAPITEAVVAFNFTPAFSDEQVSRLASRNKNYAFHDKNLITNYELNLSQESVKLKKIDDGVKLSSLDRADLCLYRRTGFACSRLAPYSGWKDLEARARADWLCLIGNTSHRVKIDRIGVRFINRIDVLRQSDEAAHVEDYLEVWPRLPNLDDGMRIGGYLMQLSRAAPELCQVTINSTISAPSPIPGADSFVLDVDLYRVKQIPESEEGVWDLLQKMRVIKNELFERLITEKARALFR